jgi:predicted secreted protein
MDNMDYRIIELHVNTGGQRPPVMYAERAMVQSMDARKAPAVEAGTSKLTVTVSGSVQFF